VPRVESPLVAGETVLLYRSPEDSELVILRPGSNTIGDRGVVDLSGSIGQPPGSVVRWGGREYRTFRPTLSDLYDHLHRKAQIVLPKDAMQLLYLAGVGPGRNVVEAGSGSGALTIALAYAVGPMGRVVSYDRRPDFLDVARGNVGRSGLSDRVEFRHRDVQTDGIEPEGFDAAVLDLPEPWSAVPSLREALRPGGRCATYTPTYNQLERTVRSLREGGFASVESLELLARALHVGEGGTRPEFEMLGHTGFLTGARKVG
jgi:tRNA (adenine57-N1/adenine58-N1)-methyltransferase